MKASIFVALATVLFAGCAHRSGDTKMSSARWPFPIHGQLADSDVAQIIAMTRRIPEIEHDIAWIEVKSADRIQVYTGHVYAPLAGGGNVIELRKRKGRWIVMGDPRTSVWNA